MVELGTKLSTKNTERQRQTDHLAKLKKFLQNPSPYVLMSRPKLDEIMNSRGILNTENRSKKVDEKKDLLIAHDKGELPTTTVIEAGPTSISEKLLDTLHCQAFLPKLNAEGLEYCKIGHDSEVPLAIQFLGHSCKGDTSGFVVHGISRPGLVAKKGKEYVKGTIDFIAAATTPESDVKSIIGIEVKTRVSSSTAQAERRRQQRLLMNNPNLAAVRGNNSLLYR